jgi:hypothetical protein
VYPSCVVSAIQEELSNGVAVEVDLHLAYLKCVCRSLEDELIIKKSLLVELDSLLGDENDGFSAPLEKYIFDIMGNRRIEKSRGTSYSAFPSSRVTFSVFSCYITLQTIKTSMMRIADFSYK